MISFWDRVWAVTAMSIRDYYKERDAQQKRWDDFCKKCTQEILEECSNISRYIQKAVEKQTGVHIHKDLADGIIQLPLYGFHIALRSQPGLVREQDHILDLFFSNFSIPFSKQAFINTVRIDNDAKKELFDLVGISEEKAGRFWVQFFKVLYRTDNDTESIEKIIDSFCAITMRFSAVSHGLSEAILPTFEAFIKSVHIQSELCRLEPNDIVDFYGDLPFVEHFSKAKEEIYKVCNMCMEEPDEDLNPDQFFRAFIYGILYQVIRRCSRNRDDKIQIMDDVLSKIDMGSACVDGKYIFKYMEDLHGEETTMLAFMMHTFTDIEDNQPMGWILITRFSGTYNLETGQSVYAVQEATNFIIGVENYLADKYPLSGFGDIATKYARRVADIISKDIDENVTIVDDEPNKETSNITEEMEKTVDTRQSPQYEENQKKKHPIRDFFFGKH